jgi:zinc transport system substrate-binding protein
LPAHASGIETRVNRLGGKLAALDARLLAVGETLAGAPVVFSHPVYQYLERRYRLNGRSVHWEPGEAPDAAQWVDFDNLLETHPARLMIWEAPPLAQTRAALEKRHIEVVVYRTLSSRPAAGDFLQSMTDNVDALSAAASGLATD